MAFLVNYYLKAYRKWLHSWNDGYPLIPYQHTAPGIPKGMYNYWGTIQKLSNEIKKEIESNLKIITSKDDFEKYKIDTINFFKENERWLKTEAISEADFIAKIEPEFDNIIYFNQDLQNYPIGYHYGKFKSYNAQIEREVMKLLDGFEPYFPEEKPSAKSIHIPGLKSAHLYILMHAIDRALPPKIKIPKTEISNILAQTFHLKNGKNFSAGSIIKVKYNNPTDTEMDQVVNVLTNLIDIINNEYDEGIEGEYFKEKNS